MKSQEFQDKMNSIQEKIGEEASGLIIDEIGLLLTDNKNVNNELQEKDKEIEKLKARNESLMNVNANLLQQVAMADDPDVQELEDNAMTESFDFRTAFDENGNFKK